MLDSIHIEAAGTAAFEASEEFARLRDFAGLVIKNAERRITSRPLGKKIDGALEALGGLRRFAFENGDDAEPPGNFARRRDACESLAERRGGAIDIFAA